jgi:hypothetical protein
MCEENCCFAAKAHVVVTEVEEEDWALSCFDGLGCLVLGITTGNLSASIDFIWKMYMETLHWIEKPGRNFFPSCIEALVSPSPTSPPSLPQFLYHITVYKNSLAPLLPFTLHHQNSPKT